MDHPSWVGRGLFFRSKLKIWIPMLPHPFFYAESIDEGPRTHTVAVWLNLYVGKKKSNKLLENGIQRCWRQVLMTKSCNLCAVWLKTSDGGHSGSTLFSPKVYPKSIIFIPSKLLNSTESVSVAGRWVECVERSVEKCGRGGGRSVARRGLWCVTSGSWRQFTTIKPTLWVYGSPFCFLV